MIVLQYLQTVCCSDLFQRALLVGEGKAQKSHLEFNPRRLSCLRF